MKQRKFVFDATGAQNEPSFCSRGKVSEDRASQEEQLTEEQDYSRLAENSPIIIVLSCSNSPVIKSFAQNIKGSLSAMLNHMSISTKLALSITLK